MDRPIITLTTDFGVCDSYVAQMKGVILGISPQAMLVDVTHMIAAQDCAIASAVVAEVIDAFPIGAIHVVVVDPGVGTDRRAVAVEARAGTHADSLRFVAPDNGVLSAALRKLDVVRAVELAEPRFWRTPVSHTFHGRDIFAPVAAHWSRGVDLAQFGPPLESPLIQLPAESPVREEDMLRGRIVRRDRFGNLITNIDASLLGESDRPRLTIEIASWRIRGVSQAYRQRPTGELVAVIGSSGRLEIAAVRGNAGEVLAAGPGDSVVIKGLPQAITSDGEPPAHG